MPSKGACSGQPCQPSAVRTARVFAVAEFAQHLRGLLYQLRHDLDTVDLAHELREDCSLVARAAADLEHTIVGLGVQQFRHQRHDERLGDRLSVTDRQR